MKQAYNELYLEDAMENMGEMLDYAVNVCGMDADEFWKLFISSGLADSFGKGMPKVVSGLSGTELVYEVYDKTGNSQEIYPVQIEFGRSREYWSGWILAYYQWLSGKSFASIHKTVPMKEILRLYPTLHEASEERFVEVMERLVSEYGQMTNLQKIRRSLGYSQAELATHSGVNKRMIQQYEIGAKDINKAAGITLLALAQALNCDIKDLLEI